MKFDETKTTATAGGVATAGSAPYLLLAQTILLALYYGAHWTSMPWWVVFLPLIIWIAIVLVVVFIIGEFLIFAVGAALDDAWNIGPAVLVGIVLNIVLIYGVYWIFTSAMGFLAHIL